jgi:hypothetical protein
MTKTINMTFLLRNPHKVRELVKQGFEVKVEFEGELVMVINLPVETIKKPLSNRPKHKIGITQNIKRVDIYNEKSWINKVD